MSYEYLEINGVRIPLPLSTFPIGSIYMSVSDVSPASFLGGTWERIKDRFLLSAGNTYEAGSQGGEADHTLTAAEMPRHAHVQNAAYNGESGITWAYPMLSYNNTVSGKEGVELDVGGTYYESSSNRAQTQTSIEGEGKSHNNMPPYLAVYMWKRVA